MGFFSPLVFIDSLILDISPISHPRNASILSYPSHPVPSHHRTCSSIAPIDWIGLDWTIAKARDKDKDKDRRASPGVNSYICCVRHQIPLPMTWVGTLSIYLSIHLPTAKRQTIYRTYLRQSYRPRALPRPPRIEPNRILHEVRSRTQAWSTGNADRIGGQLWGGDVSGEGLWQGGRVCWVVEFGRMWRDGWRDGWVGRWKVFGGEGR